jgi:hypothetical protein
LSLLLTNSAIRREEIWQSGCIDPRFLDLGTSWRWMVRFTPGLLYPRGKSPGTHWVGGWVAGLDDMEKRKFLTLPGLDCPARSQSVYRLRHPGSMTHWPTFTNSKMLFAHSGALSKLLKFIVHLSDIRPYHQNPHLTHLTFHTSLLLLPGFHVMKHLFRTLKCFVTFFQKRLNERKHLFCIQNRTYFTSPTQTSPFPSLTFLVPLKNFLKLLVSFSCTK